MSYSANPEKVSRFGVSIKEGKMKMTRVLMSLALVASLAAPALAGNVAAPLPGPGPLSVNAHSAFSEIFLTIEAG